MALEKTRKLQGWEGWNTIMMALWRATSGSDEGYEIALNWCRKNKYKHIGAKSEKYVHDTWYKLGRWISDRCERKVNAWTSSGDLFASWKSWAEENNEWVGSQTKFSIDMQEAGFKQFKTEHANGFTGLRVLPRESFSEYGDRYKPRR